MVACRHLTINGFSLDHIDAEKEERGHLAYSVRYDGSSDIHSVEEIRPAVLSIECLGRTNAAD